MDESQEDRSADVSSRSSGTPATSSAKPNRVTRPAPVSQRIVEVKSPLAPLALVASVMALGFAGLLFWQMSILDADRKNLVQQLASADARIAQLEQKLTVTGNESEQSLASLGATLRVLDGGTKELEAEVKEHSSEIRKLWGVANDRNRKAIEENSKGLELVKQALESLKVAQQQDQQTLQKVLDDLQGELAVVSEVQESQQSALSQYQNVLADIQALKTDVNNRLSANEEAIKSIDAFRLQVNRQLLQLGGPAN
jgi:chromosome segregation ATPase